MEKITNHMNDELVNNGDEDDKKGSKEKKDLDKPALNAIPKDQVNSKTIADSKYDKQKWIKQFADADLPIDLKETLYSIPKWFTVFFIFASKGKNCFSYEQYKELLKDPVFKSLDTIRLKFDSPWEFYANLTRFCWILWDDDAFELIEWWELKNPDSSLINYRAAFIDNRVIDVSTPNSTDAHIVVQKSSKEVFHTNWWIKTIIDSITWSKKIKWDDFIKLNENQSLIHEYDADGKYVESYLSESRLEGTKIVEKRYVVRIYQKMDDANNAINTIALSNIDTTVWNKILRYLNETKQTVDMLWGVIASTKNVVQSIQNFNKVMDGEQRPDNIKDDFPNFPKEKSNWWSFSEWSRVTWDPTNNSRLDPTKYLPGS
jgi:hypothetical protein